MGTIPTPPTIAAGADALAVDQNKLGACIKFIQTPPSCWAFQNTGQTISSSAVYTVVNLDGEVYENPNNYDGGGDAAAHDTVTNNSRMYARTAGKYRITGQITFTSNATGTRAADIRMNAAGSNVGGTDVLVSTQSALGSSTATSVPFQSPLVVFAAGDYVEMFAYQSSGGALLLLNGSRYTYLALELVSA